MINCKPSQIKRKEMRRANVLTALEGNLGNVKSNAVLRKIKSEGKKRLQRDENNLVDAIMMRQDHPEYIKKISDPFNIVVFSDEQIRIANSIENKIEYFDATGGIVRNSDDEIVYSILSRFGGSAGRETTNVAQVCLLYLYTDDDA